MHTIFGYTLDEWGSIILILTTVLGAFGALLKYFVKAPMEGVRDDLKANQIEQKETNRTLNNVINEHGKLLTKHTIMLQEHGFRIRDLEAEEGKNFGRINKND